MVIDAERLILEVRIREPLYNTHCSQYANRPLKDALWMEVAEAVGSTVHECRTKWKTLRDSFVREAREDKAKGTDEEHKKRRYVHFELLTFLYQYMNKRTSSKVTPVDHDTDETDSHASTGTADNEAEYLAALDMCSTSSSPARKRQLKVDDKLKSVKRSAVNPVTSSISQLSSIAQSPSGVPPLVFLDEDAMFFQSLLPSFRQLPPPLKSALKIQIAQLVHDSLYGTPESTVSSGNAVVFQNGTIWKSEMSDTV